jgi:hypothetical protein
MKKLILILLHSFMCLLVHAQVEQLIIETYYIADNKDASDTTGGGVAAGSVTYRLFLDLVAGNKLKSIYGSPNHPLKFASTERFFNNSYRDKSFGYQINKNNLDNNTVALDTWLTMGFASHLNYGVPKNDDDDGSIVGGTNNDGGSGLVEGGLLINTAPAIGIPLTQADGLVVSPINTSGFFNIGFLAENGDDSTIFGSLATKNTFMSYSGKLMHNLGIEGINNENKILIAQLTTSGELSFEINVEIEKADGSIVNYVSNESVAGVDTFYSKWLKYPLSCGCTDPSFLEFDKAATCDNGSCLTPVIFGCTDPLACNYDPNANRNLPELCCYNSQCALLLDIVCPGTVYGCTDPNSLNYNPAATTTSDLDTCCYVGGCMDDRYLEYNPDACFDDGSYCKVLKIPGCMDRAACNYNPFATVPQPEDCIYGCSEMKSSANWMNAEPTNDEIKVYPNPVSDFLKVEIGQMNTSVNYSIYDVFGKAIVQNSKSVFNQSINFIDVKSFPDGIYLLEIHANGTHITRKIVKQSW